MFFIAFLMEPEIHIVIPVTWVYDYEKIIQKCIRNSINRNQKCLIFYSNKRIDGIPDESIVANFTAPTSTVFPIVGDEACFISKITHYFNIYGEAKAHCDRLRSQPPRVYNENRLNELPIPIIPSIEDNNSSFVSSDGGTEHEIDTNHSTPDLICANDFNEPNLVDFVAIESTGHNSSVVSSTVLDMLQLSHEVFLPRTEVDSGLDPGDPFEINPIKEEPELNLDDEDQNQVDFILMDLNDRRSSDSDESDDELVFLDEDKLDKFPMPISATIIGLTKRESDPISGSIAFNEKKNGDRIYKVGEVLKVLPVKILNAIRSWATFPFKNREIYDEKMANVLLICLQYKKADDDAKKAIGDFVRSLVETRVGMDMTRKDKVTDYIEEFEKKHS